MINNKIYNYSAQYFKKNIFSSEMFTMIVRFLFKLVYFFFLTFIALNELSFKCSPQNNQPFHLGDPNIFFSKF